MEPGEAGKTLTLFFPAVGDCAEVWLNGHRAGTLTGDGGRVSIRDWVRPGANALVVDVTNTLVWQVRDPVSTQAQLDPTGMTRPPVLEIWE